jgi:hypothetical protein
MDAIHGERMILSFGENQQIEWVNRSNRECILLRVELLSGAKKRKKRKRDGLVIFLCLYFIQGLYQFRRWSMTHSYTLHSSHFGALGYKSPQITY